MGLPPPKTGPPPTLPFREPPLLTDTAPPSPYGQWDLLSPLPKRSPPPPPPEALAPRPPYRPGVPHQHRPSPPPHKRRGGETGHPPPPPEAGAPSHGLHFPPSWVLLVTDTALCVCPPNGPPLLPHRLGGRGSSVTHLWDPPFPSQCPPPQSSQTASLLLTGTPPALPPPHGPPPPLHGTP